MQVVVITWTDAAYNTGIYDKEDLHDFGLITMTTVGYLIEEREDCYILASEHYSDQGRFRHLQAIPKSGVTQVRKLRKS